VINFQTNFLISLLNKNCHGYGAKCVVEVDAFYVLTIICAILGVLWIYKFKSVISYLQSLSKQDWKITELKKKQNILK
jgi:hypothetical protein